MKNPKNRLTFLRFSHFYHYKRPSGFTEKIPFNLYQCECGNQKVIRESSVLNHRSQSAWSCGCLRRDNMRDIHSKGLNRHGGNKHCEGRGATNKGKIRIKENGRNRYVTMQELTDIYYGL